MIGRVRAISLSVYKGEFRNEVCGSCTYSIMKSFYYYFCFHLFVNKHLVLFVASSGYNVKKLIRFIYFIYFE